MRTSSHGWGHHPVQRRANAIWYKSPYREEKTPSFKVNPDKNLWFDFGEGKGGNIFALAGEFIKSGDFLTQVRYVAEVTNMSVQDYEPYHHPEVRQPAGHSFENVEVQPLQSRALLHYLQERGIPSAVAIANCKEIHYTTHGKRYFAVAFGNEGGGYEMRNPFFKGCVPPKDVTLLSVGSDACNVYEGFMDYLSARALGIGGREDHLVLNSVSNVARHTSIWTTTEGCNAILTTTKPGGGHWKPCAHATAKGCRTAPASTADART